MPMTIVGWVSGPESIPALLRDVAKKHEETIKEWEDATPSAH
jgi:hypothetical protein